MTACGCEWQPVNDRIVGVPQVLTMSMLLSERRAVSQSPSLTDGRLIAC